MPTEFLPPDQKLTSDIVDYHHLTESKAFNHTTSQSFVRLKYIMCFYKISCM